MYKTIISHFYNEEYLLPWWLEHHKKYFNHGIMINYASTDNSVNIIRQICPDWTVIDSRNKFFDAKLIDEEVIDIESNVTGWKTCLNTTEFLVGDFSLMNNTPYQEITVPCFIMVDAQPEVQPTYSEPLVDQKHHGIHYHGRDPLARRPRLIHNKKKVDYPLGRHYSDYTTDKLKVLWYGWSPFNKKTLDRKLQIQNRIPETDKARGFGSQHIADEHKLNTVFRKDYLPFAINLKSEYK
jgi:hypothetical protein|tara:strand:+ start:124 stop:840 length:717 start_codon:yes stop_codon:yes gene_type:complete